MFSISFSTILVGMMLYARIKTCMSIFIVLTLTVAVGNILRSSLLFKQFPQDLVNG